MKLEVGKFYKTRDGRKVGPMAAEESPGMTSFHWNIEGSGVGRWDEDGDDGFAVVLSAADDDLIAPWPAEPTGPVRTVTRKEIVFGVHGDVEIVEDDTHQGGIGIYINATMSATRIRAAANSMIAVADAMEEGK